jgi:predicted Zn-dependent protease
LTRDGTFLIENGRIKHAVKNFRFNESPVIMLNNLDELGRPERAREYLIPPMRVRDFTFSSLSDAV